MNLNISEYLLNNGEEKIKTISVPQFEKCFVVSSGHITESDSYALEKLEKRSNDLDCPSVFGYFGGWLIRTVTTNSEELIAGGLSESLDIILSYGIEHGCTLIKIDQDGPVYDFFELYDW